MDMSKKSRFWSGLMSIFKREGLLLPLLSGVFIGTSYIPFPPWAYLFCFVPIWLYWAKQKTLKGVLVGGVVTSFVFTLIGFNWVAYMMHEFAHLDWPFAVAALFVFALGAHLFLPLAGMGWFLVTQRLKLTGGLSFSVMALSTALCEAYTPTLFDWDFGYSWYGAGVPLYQLAEWVGFGGLSALTILVNLPMVYAWNYRNQVLGKRLFAWVLFGFLSCNLVGLWLEHRLPAPDAHVRVLLVQGNIGNAEKVSAELGQGYQTSILAAFMKATDLGLKSSDVRPDLVVWPETAFPALLGEGLRPSEYRETLKAFLQSRQIPLITGAYGYDVETGLLTNSLFVLNPQGDIVHPHYSKTILLAFGEYIPGEDYFPVIRQWLPPIGQFARGQGPTSLLSYKDFKMGPQICYESLFSWFSRSLSDLGAQFIVNATNDSWYGWWQEPYQHMYMTLARGVEYRRPVIRATNTGVSTVSLASGQILERSPVQEVWAGQYDIPYKKQPSPTFFQRTYWLVPSSLWLSLFVLLTLGWARRKEEVK
jgi:apolipoprotein N-acyltransferase